MQRWAIVLILACLTQSRVTAQAADDKPGSKSWQRIHRQGFFTVSCDPDNLPYSSRKGKPSGFEVELAHALAKRLGLKAKIDWIEVRHETSLGKLLEKECDLVMGLPVDPRLYSDDEKAAGRIIYTKPYYRTGYLLFVRKKGPRVAKLEQLKGEQTRRLGTQAGTVADFVLKQRGYQRKLYPSQSAALKALAQGRIDYAYLWSNAAWIVHSSEGLDVELVQPYILEDWRNMAAAVRTGDQEFRDRLDKAFAGMVNEKLVMKLLKKYGLPHYPAKGTTRP